MSCEGNESLYVKTQNARLARNFCHANQGVVRGDGSVIGRKYPSKPAKDTAVPNTLLRRSRGVSPRPNPMLQIEKPSLRRLSFPHRG